MSKTVQNRMFLYLATEPIIFRKFGSAITGPCAPLLNKMVGSVELHDVATNFTVKIIMT